MTHSTELPKGTTTAASSRFDRTSMILHWLTVLLIVMQFSSIWWREGLDHNSPLAATLLHVHRSAGVLIWFVAVARLVWRRSFAYLPPFPATMSKLQQNVSKANEYGLYALLLIQPVTGLGRVLLRGTPFDLFFWKVPALVEPDEALRKLVSAVHEFGATALLVLIGLHAGTALFHRLVLRDGVLHRMLPWRAPPLAVGEAE